MNPTAAQLWLAPDRPAGGDLGLLCPEERARADRLRHAAERARFVAAHALLRRALSRRAGRPPEAWRFARDARGRPWVVGEGPCFSLSHCPGLVAALVADAPEVGVDVERVGRVQDPLAVAAGYFPPEERAALAAADPDARDRLFSRLWCLREAWAKAVGGGLDLPVAAAVFALPPAGPTLALPPDLGRAADWTLRLLDPSPSHVLGLALGGGRSWRVDLRREAPP